MTDKQPLYLGIDGGGTKCKARIETADGKFVGEGLAGPANVVRGIATTIEAIELAAKKALQQAGLEDSVMSKLHAGLGLAGMNVASYGDKMSSWQHPFKTMAITTDMHIACLGAHGGSDGAVIIAGTGFCAGASINNQYFEVGGHGLMLGDGGSGARLGLMAVRKVLEVLDGVADKGALADAILEYLRCRDANAVLEKTINEKPAFFAGLAPLVFKYADQDEPAAVEIINSVAGYIDLFARRLLKETPPRLSLIGGIASPITPWLAPDVSVQLSAPLNEPEVGAIYFSRQSVTT